MKVFTTGQVAKLCNVSHRTVAKWIDDGRLPGWRIPGSQDRRVALDALVVFCRDSGIPVDELMHERKGILLVSADDALIANLGRLLPKEGYTFQAAESAFDAGMLANSMGPDAVLVDFTVGHDDALRVCRHLRRNSRFVDVALFAIMPREGTAPTMDRLSVNEVFRRPFDVALMAHRLNTFLNREARLLPTNAKAPMPPALNLAAV